MKIRHLNQSEAAKILIFCANRNLFEKISTRCRSMSVNALLLRLLLFFFYNQ